MTDAAPAQAQPAEAPDRYPAPDVQRRVFLTVTALIGGDAALFTLVIPALPIFQDRYELSDAAVVLIFGIFPLTQLLTTIPLAGMIDRTGRRPVMIVGAFALLLSTLGFALVDTVGLLLLTRAIQGSAAALVWTAGIAAISDVYPQSQLGFRLGLAETVGGGIGLVGPVAGGTLIEFVGTDEAFLFATAIPFLLLTMALRVPETVRAGAGAPPLLQALSRLWARPEAKAGIIGVVAYAGLLAIVDSLLPLDLDDRLDASTATIGIVFGIGFAGLTIFAPIAGAWSDRRGRRPAMLTGALVCAATLPFIGFGPIWLVAIGFFVFGCGLATMAVPSGPLLVLGADRSGMEGMYGVTSAIINLVFAMGYTLGPILGAASALALPLWAVAIVASGLLLLCAAAFRRLLPADL
jgi:MFS transporter, DHA1 family, solute carrier family 18 (vesicular amine transporter), member 1/2